MRIPQYESQVNTPSAPQFNQIADVRNDDLAQIADGLNEVYKVKLKEQEEAKKTAIFQADTSIKMELDKAAFDVMEKIKNGGSYADAENAYQKAHDNAVAKYASAFDVDESGNTKLRAMSEYQADGLQNLLRIRDAVTSRRRSDTVSSANARLSMLQEEYALAGQDQNKRNEVMGKMSSTMAGLAGIGVITGDEGKMRLKNALRGAEQNRIELLRQNNPDNPQLILDEIEKNQSVLGIETYISERGKTLTDLQRVDSASRVTEYMSDPTGYQGMAIQQQDVDLFYQNNIVPLSQQSVESYESAIIQTASVTGKVPSQVVRQANTFFNMDASTISATDEATISSMANVVSSIGKRPDLVGQNGVSKDDVVKANILKSRIDSGISPQQAMMDMRTVTQNEQSLELYKSALSESKNILVGTKASGVKVDMPEIPKYANSDFMQSYAIHRSLGATQEEASNLAQEEINSSFGEFNGKLFKDAATNFDTRFSEESFIGAAKGAMSSVGYEPPQGATFGVVADAITKKQYMKTGNKNDVTYAVMLNWSDTNEPVYAIDSKTGSVIRFKLNISADKKQPSSGGYVEPRDSMLKTLNIVR